MNAPTTLKLLAIDDDAQALEIISLALKRQGLEIITVQDPEEGFETFLRTRPRIVLLDLVMPKVSGMEILERIVAVDPGVDVILITAHYSPESAVEAIQKGASDYLTKPIDIEKLRARIANLLEEAETRLKTLRLDQELIDAYQFEGMVGRSPLMLEVYAKIRRIAPHFRTVLVTGATGTGKELVAKALHRLSPASRGPFVVCNCSALVDNLVETELFGYVRGAFTGATQDKVGMFEHADRGTIFLDEIGELAPATQSKLLRVLQNRQVQRVVAVVEIPLPVLASRREDLPLLERYFIEKFSGDYNKPIAGLVRRAQTRLATYPWPGNVRELENVIGNACMMADGSLIDIGDLPERLRGPLSEDIRGDEAFLSLEELQRRHILRVLDAVGGNKARAAEVLGIGRATIYQLLSRMKIEELEEGTA